MKYFEKILAVFVVFAIFISMIPTVFAAEPSGKCGEKLSWSFDEATGKLSISGSGDMDDYASNAPWAALPVCEVSLPDGLTGIGSYAFSGLDIAHVTIPDSVKRIGAGAFAYTAIKSVQFGTGIREVPNYAFQSTQLESVILPETIQSIGYEAFGYCTKLARVAVLNKSLGIDEYGFHEFPVPMASDVNIGTPYITFYGYAGSTAQTHAAENPIMCGFKAITEWNCEKDGHPYKGGICAACEGENLLAAFKDLPKVGTWQYDAIAYCVEHGIMNGMSTTEFSPNGNLTRGQLVTVLYRVAGKPEVSYEKVFPDVRSNEYYTLPIIWAAKNGIVNGFEDGTFRPNTPVTREQLATILYRYSGSPAVSGDLSAYPDAAAVQSYSKLPMLWATQNGFLPGTTEEIAKRLAPRANAARVQIAGFIMRYLES